MNRTTKGAVAALAAGVLLLGGAGTLAYWSDSETVGTGDIQSGQLQITGVGTGAWASVTGGGDEEITDIAAFRAVPGDVLQYTVPVTVVGTGDNLAATVDVDASAITGDPELVAALDIVATSTPTTITTSGTVDVQVLVTFDSTTADLIAQGDTVDLSSIEIVLEQTAPVAGGN